MNILARFVKSTALLALVLSVTLHSPEGRSYPVPGDKDVIGGFGFPSKKSLSKRINILVWNLHKGEDETFATDFIELAYKKDLVLGQEMFLNPVMEMVFGSFPHYRFTSATSFFIGKDLIRTGVTTASPVSPSKVDFVRTQTLEPIVNSPKVTLVSRYPIKFSTKELTVVNIHGINFVDSSSYRKEMDRIYETVKNYPSPIIIAGDFNTWNEERNAILRDLSKKLKLKAANFFPDHRMTFNNHPLDHFLYTEDLRVIEAKVEGFYQGSDHKPLEVLVEYSPLNSLFKIARRH